MAIGRIARAPGKLFVLGEYAVLDGCPALVAAVDRFAMVATSEAGPRRSVRIEAPELDCVAEWKPDRLPPVGGPLRFPLAVMHVLRRLRPTAVPAQAKLIVRSELNGSDTCKPGLGSSAAVTVATAAHLLSTDGVDIESGPGRQLLFAVAWQAHRLAQGGRGSGADVAASVYGGLTLLTSGGEGPPVVRRLDLPGDLILLAAWSGTGASTIDMIAYYESLQNGHRARRRGFVDACVANVERWLSNPNDSPGLLEAVSRANADLEDLARHTGLPLFTPALRTAIAIAAKYGAAAKLSGAGGGDCAIAFTTNSTSAKNIVDAWKKAGIQPLRLCVAHQGVTVANT